MQHKIDENLEKKDIFKKINCNLKLYLKNNKNKSIL